MNKDSYNSDEAIRYYREFLKVGLFKYEEILINQYFVAYGRTLDIGCGTGRTTKPLSKMNFDVVGIDYSESMIGIAKTLNPNINFETADVLDLPFENNSFKNIIFSFNGLMLVGDYKKRLIATKEIKRVLKPNGIFIFSTPFLDNKIYKSYWQEKIKKLGYNYLNLKNDERLSLGDEVLEDCGVLFSIHIPFLDEIRKMLYEAELEIKFAARRLDYTGIEVSEDELDDNYVWVVGK